MKQETLYGIHTITTILNIAPWRVKKIFLLAKQSRLNPIFELAQAQQIPIEWCQRHYLDQLADGNHQGVIAICQAPKPLDEQALKKIIDDDAKSLLLLVLDNIVDPHNVGACLRSADAFAVDAVIVPKHQACGLTDTVKRVACGAAETVPFIQVNNLARVMKDLQAKNIWFYGLDMQGTQSIDQIDFPKRTALVLGAEGTGIRHLTAELCDELMNIPMHGQVESLNVSVAAGISLFGVRRKIPRE
ncbi:MAG: 23S rRNA (guanosine(2251)-2'-O)-methyltransferase RlmB [Pseudomonadota bacterium]